MKIEAKQFKDFVKKASLNGQINTINLNFTDEGLRSAVRCPSNIAMTVTLLRPTAFEEYEAIGEKFIKNAVSLMAYLDTFESVVTLEQDAEHIVKVFDDDRSAYVILGSDAVCDNVLEKDPPLIDTPVSIELDKKELARVVKDIGLLKINKVDLKHENKRLSLSVGEMGESDFLITHITTDSDEKAIVSVNESFIKLFEVIDKKVELSIGNDVPLVAVEVGDHYDFMCMIAPIIEK